MVAMLIGLGHTARVGKDTAAEMLVEDHGFQRIAFADALRNMAYESNRSVRKLVDEVGWDTAKVVYPSVRQYLIDLGNGARRALGEDVWINAVFAQMHSDDDWVISDCRYPNEVQAILDHGGMVIKITRVGIQPLNNVADQALAGWTGWSAEIHNDGSLDDLRASVTHLLATR